MLSIVEQLQIAAGRIGADSAPLLADCQEAAITLGTRLEQICGEGTRTVAELEAYCEELYQVGEALAQGEEQSPSAEQSTGRAAVCGAGGESAGSAGQTNGNDIAGIRTQLARRLESVEACLKEDMPDRQEIVFLPYNASMWDSLESVWMAARDDEDCDAYVIPIPYYDKNADGTLGELHYEGDRFPDYVPITHYDAYDLAVHHPDVIYFHNPYDEYNIVTSVDPRFFSRRIHYFTEKLVYIPYFVLTEPNPDSEAELEGLTRYAYVPGVINADQVILQSEDMRKAYIKIHIREMTKWGISFDKEALERKFLGTGSPKFDRLGRVSVDEETLPGSWLRVLKKPDGTRKKVIFYNTSLAAMLTGGPKMIIKIINVLQTFREYQAEVALLWRPHPLMRATLEAMHPELWDKYRMVTETYKGEGWGIYDDSADLDRAIALADAYYGDWSSVVQLCQKAGMPVMIQNVDIGEA
jgi:hypothetical protein